MTVPMMARQAAADPDMDPRNAAKIIPATARPPGRVPNVTLTKSLKGTMPPLLSIKFPASIKKGQAKSGYEFMEEKNICARASRDIPMEKRAIRLEPNAKAIARGVPLKNIKTIKAIPI